MTVNEFPEYEESVFSCGHTSKLSKRSITEGLKITENVQVTPEKGEKIPVTVSGDTGVKIQGNLNRIDVQIEQNKPTYFNINIMNVNASKTDISQNILQANSINNIVTNVEQSSLSTDAKIQVKKLISEFDQEAKLPKPDHHKLKSILSKVFPVAIDVGLMLLKYGLDHGLLSASTAFQ